MAVYLLRSLFPRHREAREYHSVTRDSSPGSSTSHDDLLEYNYSHSRSHSASMNEKPFSTSLSVDSHESSRISPRIISDATIGLSDGLTVPFALTAGLSALGKTDLVIYAGLAELMAGGISMGLGGYLGAKSEAEAYHATLTSTRAIIARQDYDTAQNLVRATFEDYDFSEEALRSMIQTLLSRPDSMVDFLMRFHHRLDEADCGNSRAYQSGATIGLGYICGGLIPLLPYFFCGTIQQALPRSVIVMAFALFAFGWFKTSLVGETNKRICFVNGLQMLILGGVAAAAAMGCVRVVGNPDESPVFQSG